MISLRDMLPRSQASELPCPDYRLVYLVCLVHFVRFVRLPLLLDLSPW